MAGARLLAVKVCRRNCRSQASASLTTCGEHRARKTLDDTLARSSTDKSVARRFASDTFPPRGRCIKYPKESSLPSQPPSRVVFSIHLFPLCPSEWLNINPINGAASHQRVLHTVTATSTCRPSNRRVARPGPHRSIRKPASVVGSVPRRVRSMRSRWKGRPTGLSPRRTRSTTSSAKSAEHASKSAPGAESRCRLPAPQATRTDPTGPLA